jgi:ketosteroid isomerase-like protein
MRLFKFILPLVFMTSLPGTAPDTFSAAAQQESKAQSAKKLEREILKAENQLGNAIGKRDVASLDKLLTDYYADSYEGEARAEIKATTLARCREGTLHFYRIDHEREIEARADIVRIEGIAKLSRKSPAGSERNSEIRVKRLWTKKDGRWQLVAQTVGPVDEESEK